MTTSRNVDHGLRRVAMDLHVHTPASHDWNDDACAPADLVQQALNVGLQGIAITDHQTGDWVDRVKEASKGTDLAVFPGVEVDTLAGSTGVHILALFDLGTSSQDIDRFLAAIGAVGGVGEDRRRTTATKGILEVLDEIQERNGIAILAHCQSTKGTFSEMRGEVRTQVVQHPAVLAVEARAADFYDKAKASSRRRTYDILDGTDATYKRKLATIQSSDNPAVEEHGHRLQAIGGVYTYYWVGRPITLESLRQCFIDREVRVEYPPPDEAQPQQDELVSHPRIAHVAVKSGFLDGLQLSLHPGLTTLIGSKGSGKSLLIELIRFALAQPPTQPELLQDHDTKLKERLGLYGTVTLTLIDAADTEHTITRTYDPASGNPFADDSLDIAEVFPCHILSQGEIVRLAEREDEQIKFIDSFFDFRSYQRAIDEVRRSLEDLDKQVAAQIRARKLVTAHTRDVKTLTERIDTVDKQLKNPVLGKYKQAQKKEHTLGAAHAVLTELAAAIQTAEQAADAIAVPELPDDLVDDPLLRRAVERARDARKTVLDRYKAMATDLGAISGEAAKDYEGWTQDFGRIERDYTEAIKTSDGDAAKLSQERTRLVRTRTDIESKLRKAELQAKQLRPTVEARNEAVAALRDKENAYTQKRQERCKWFHEQSDGKIRASVEPGSNVDVFRDKLDSMKRGSRLPSKEIDSIAEGVAPDDFVRALLRFDLSRRESDLDAISKATGLDASKVTRLAEFLLDENEYEALLALQYTVTPTDRPKIEFRLPDGNYAPLERLSTGQKCTAFLVMTLCEGKMPIIVDQPEDSLDIRSIWDDMCSRLRTSKRMRQFVFTTHNSSLSVASDSDKFVVLAADGSRGDVSLAGAIDGSGVRGDVISLLEGGAETYYLKQRKYDLKDPFS